MWPLSPWITRTCGECSLKRSGNLFDEGKLGDSTISGLEVEMKALVTDRFTLGMNLGLLDDEIDSLKGVLISNTVTITKDNDRNTPDYVVTDGAI